MIGLKKRDIKKALKAGAKAGGVSLADVRADIEATIDEAMTSPLAILMARSISSSDERSGTLPISFKVFKISLPYIW